MTTRQTVLHLDAAGEARLASYLFVAYAHRKRDRCPRGRWRAPCLQALAGRTLPPMKNTLSLALAILLLPAVVLAKGGGARAGIEAGNKAFMAAVDKGDAAGVAACYTADAKVMPPNTEAVAGTKDIAAMFQGLAKDGLKIALSTGEVFDGGDSATEIGTYVVSDAKGTPLDTGKYIVLWKKDGGTWKLHRDIWNSSKAPPPAPAAAK